MPTPTTQPEESNNYPLDYDILDETAKEVYKSNTLKVEVIEYDY
jgi:hypothetical protein